MTEQSRESRASGDPARSLRDVGGRRVSKTTILDRDSSRADLIGPRVALLATRPAALHRRRLGGAKEKSMREKAVRWPRRKVAGNSRRPCALSACPGSSQPLP